MGGADAGRLVLGRGTHDNPATSGVEFGHEARHLILVRDPARGPGASRLGLDDLGTAEALTVRIGSRRSRR
jgi:hypothetical protein